jgi:hypothetical protein
LIGGIVGMLIGGMLGTVMLVQAPATSNVATAAKRTLLNATMNPPLALCYSTSAYHREREPVTDCPSIGRSCRASHSLK